jgi:hypothetical protein
MCDIFPSGAGLVYAGRGIAAKSRMFILIQMVDKARGTNGSYNRALHNFTGCQLQLITFRNIQFLTGVSLETQIVIILYTVLYIELYPF